MSRLRNQPSSFKAESAVPVVAEALQPEMQPAMAEVVAPEVKAPKVEPAKSKAVLIEVRARVAFADTVTNKNYKPGDMVSGWDEARITHYASRGLVDVQSHIGPSEFK